MTADRLDLPQGTLELLILKTLAPEPRHGWGISERIRQVLGPACARERDLREWMKETLSVLFSGTVAGDVLTGTASETARVTSGDESHEVHLAIEVRLMR